jgi:hypothetical protein
VESFLKVPKCETFVNSDFDDFYTIKSLFKGIVRPFELGGETRLIRSAVKYWKHGTFKKKIMIQPHERSIKPFSVQMTGQYL